VPVIDVVVAEAVVVAVTVQALGPPTGTNAPDANVTVRTTCVSVTVPFPVPPIGPALVVTVTGPVALAPLCVTTHVIGVDVTLPSLLVRFNVPDQLPAMLTGVGVGVVLDELQALAANKMLSTKAEDRYERILRSPRRFD
jgi:hypothetical protein